MSIRTFTVLGERNAASRNKTSTQNLQEKHIMDDELDPTKIAETAIGVFIGVLAFRIVKIIIKGFCE